MTANLLPALNQLGLAKGYSPKAFRKLARTPIDIGEVIQKTVIKVDEEGTEAAAATAVKGRAMQPVDKVAMVVDRPFLFALRDTKHELILLAGYIGNPNAK
jgi:serpin B